ncbi:hypothetical protein BN8_05113 [Fibrisoma limi BUZ 3]|uniref:DUF433 domain-containing protein n=2 Tax=Fibrisoma limi TaxID=663275 RepID=I2GPJ8_9BACT|nr:hypothetical protein BN8_05113 [Fibrisoma limi BUZ 3]
MMNQSLLSRITINPNIGHGKPTIRNKRYLVESMLEYLAGGDTIDDLLQTFPDLEREDLQACLLFAVETIHLKSANLAAAA